MQHEKHIFSSRLLILQSHFYYTKSESQKIKKTPIWLPYSNQLKMFCHFPKQLLQLFKQLLMAAYQIQFIAIIPRTLTSSTFLFSAQRLTLGKGGKCVGQQEYLVQSNCYMWNQRKTHSLTIIHS